METTSDAAFTLDFSMYDDKKISILPTPKGTRRSNIRVIYIGKIFERQNA
jgi:hypothetical protein